MEGGAFHDGAGQRHGLKVRHGRHNARPAYLIINANKWGGHLFRLELVGDGPTRIFRRHPQLLLQVETVDLDDDAVNREVQLFPFYVPIVHEVNNLRDAVCLLQHLRHAEAPLLQVLDAVVVGGVRKVLAHHIVEAEVEAAAGHLGALLQLQGSGGGVAGIGERRFTDVFPLFVQRLEASEVHQDLAAHLEKVGIAGALQPQWHRLDGADVGRHVVAFRAVAAGHGAGHQPVFVPDADGQPVVFQLAGILNILIDNGFDAVVELQKFLFRVGVAQGKHRVAVRHAFELLGDGAAHPQRRTVGLHELRVLRLQRLQLLQQLVEFVVADDRRIQHIVSIGMLVQFCGQGDDFFLWGHIRLQVYQVTGYRLQVGCYSVSGLKNKTAKIRRIFERCFIAGRAFVIYFQI